MWYPAVHIARFGAFVVPQVSIPVKGISASVEVVNDGPTSISATDYTATLSIKSLDGTSLISSCSIDGAVTILSGASAVLHCTLVDVNVSLWSVQDPTTYLAVANVTTTQAYDTYAWPTGFRNAEFSADNGLNINGKPVKFRGFSHHDSFAGCGVAMPPRIDLCVIVVT